MTAQKRCPRCASFDVIVEEFEDLFFIKCRKCGYDDSLYEITAEERATQREKGRHSPYKTGGHGRTKKH